VILADHGTFHHVYDFTSFELPFGLGPLELPAPFGFQVTKFMVLQVVAVLLVLWIFRGLSQRIQNGNTAHGWWWNFWEMLAIYIRDEVVRPMIGDPHAHGHDDHGHDTHGHDEHAPLPAGTHQHPLKEAIDTKPAYAATGTHPADVYLPFVWSCFFFILICNLLGAIPMLGSATGNINVTGALAMIAFGATLLWGTQQQGVAGFWKGLVPPLDVPPALKVVLVPMMFVIEVMGLFIKHGVLAVRLFANIMGGHTVLGVILAFIAGAAGSGLWWLVTPASILGQVGVGLLELLVAFIQAYVFAFLATIFISMALHPH
jgi:F-type H+-transporting ATPase subunit a